MTQSSDGSERIRSKDDLTYGETLGFGSYSKVVIAAHNQTGVQYAVKVVSKQQIVTENKAHQVMNERNILKSLSHPNIIRLVSTFQTPDELHYVIEYAEGGELLDYITKMGRFDIPTTRRVAAELVNALEYLRSKNIIHRDLKPENVLFDAQYHIKVVDFGTATVNDAEPMPLEEFKRVNSQEVLDEHLSVEFEGDKKKDGREHGKSFVGTAQYASPELLSNCSTTYSSDLWALGCIIYQMMTGKRPFQDPSDYLTFKRILERDVRYPPDFDPTCKDLIDRLLVLNPCDRLGVGPGGFDALKAHPFFEGIAFETLHLEPTNFSWKATAPKWVPDVQVKNCSSCRIVFNIFHRKHHCRACGQIFCSACSSKTTEIPHMDYLQQVRVCNACHGLVLRRIQRDAQLAEWRRKGDNLATPPPSPGAPLIRTSSAARAS